MNEDYLTIGEVSKIKKISLKSLRYYEQIGILKPAKINPENGYRYYDNNQLLAIDMIKFLSAFDFPLKEWNRYIDAEHGFYLRELIQDGRKITYQKMEELENRLKRLELAEQDLNVSEALMIPEGVFYQRKISERHVLCCPMKKPESQVEFHKNLSILFEIAEQAGIPANYPSGRMMDYQVEGDKILQRYYTYLVVYHEMDHEYYRHFPEHSYTCVRRPQKSLLKVTDTDKDYIYQHMEGTVIEADCISSPVQFMAYPTELQFY